MVAVVVGAAVDVDAESLAPIVVVAAGDGVGLGGASVVVDTAALVVVSTAAEGALGV